MTGPPDMSSALGTPVATPPGDLEIPAATPVGLTLFIALCGPWHPKDRSGRRSAAVDPMSARTTGGSLCAAGRGLSGDRNHCEDDGSCREDRCITPVAATGCL